MKPIKNPEEPNKRNYSYMVLRSVGYYRYNAIKYFQFATRCQGKEGFHAGGFRIILVETNDESNH